jgi:hemoglobin
MTTDTRDETAVPSHFERIGGAAVVRLAVEKFYTRVLGDADLAGYFAGTDLPRLKRHQAALLTHLLGGPSAYEGRDLAEAHRHLRITGADFDRVTEHLVATLRELSTPLDIVDGLTAVLGSVRARIVLEPPPVPGKGLLAYFGFRR